MTAISTRYLLIAGTIVASVKFAPSLSPRELVWMALVACSSAVAGFAIGQLRLRQDVESA